MRVGITRGVLSAVRHSQGMHVNEAGTIETTFEMVLNDRVDTVLVIYTEAERELRRRADADRIHRWPWLWASEPQYLVLNRSRADLIPGLETAPEQMKRECLIKRTHLEALRRNNLAPLPLDPTAATACSLHRRVRSAPIA